MSNDTTEELKRLTISFGDALPELLREREAMAAEIERLREAMQTAKQTLDAASDERYTFLKEREAESEHWKSEGDMYGWNFHQGMSAGANWCDIFYRRVGRALESALANRVGC